MRNLILMMVALLIGSCSGGQKQKEQPAGKFTGAPGEVKLITLDPGHFHAALVQKSMYDQIDPVVHVYAPEGDDVGDHLSKIEAYNQRAEDPAAWNEVVYTGADFMEKMLADKAGNVVVLAGNNARKTEYILRSVEAGFQRAGRQAHGDHPRTIPPAGAGICPGRGKWRAVV